MIQLKTYDTILLELCDFFDVLIAPKKIERLNTNIIFLLLKAVAKGLEVINNLCYALNNKFNVLLCSEDDLETVAQLVGTERIAGSASGLSITITNNSDLLVILLAGLYQYLSSENEIFEFEVIEDTEIWSRQYVTFIAMSQNIGTYIVETNNNIAVVANVEIDENITFSCTNNASLLGSLQEDNLAFRQRINTDIDRQNTFSELELEIKKKPYVFDCKILFNNTTVAVVRDDVTIPPYNAIIYFAGAVKSELADIIASKIICPTVETEDSICIKYNNSVFVNGEQNIFLTPFEKVSYDVNIKYKLTEQFTDETEFKTVIRNTLYNNFKAERHTDFVTENDVYEVLKSITLTGISILAVSFVFNDDNVDYIQIPLSKIAQINEVTFDKISG